jgi:hypothetical protein
MARRLPFGLFCILLLHGAFAEDMPQDLLDMFKDKALAIRIITRVVDNSEDSSWNMNARNVTIPGRPVNVRIRGSNVIVVGKFTPYDESEDSVMLVAQGQIWLADENGQFRYFTSMKTLPVKFGEKVFFFPLGVDSQNTTPVIEVEITIVPYSQASTLDEESPTGGQAEGEAKSANPNGQKEQAANDSSVKNGSPSGKADQSGDKSDAQSPKKGGQ